ncbi:hypothetical protein [Parashewanella tropica]|uniref:hypothetical protein n=1 Tax=Parashewanella tropica TaxID=2547970 RepID=UPI00105A8437|nr:hypothetical protein [Parashewanella tropica]
MGFLVFLLPMAVLVGGSLWMVKRGTQQKENDCKGKEEQLAKMRELEKRITALEEKSKEVEIKNDKV